MKNFIEDIKELLFGVAMLYGLFFSLSLGGLCYYIDVVNGSMTKLSWYIINLPGWLFFTGTLYRSIQKRYFHKL
jgi:hypothetical protein